MEYIIGVDLGTSSAKVIAVRQDGKVMAHSQQEYTITQPAPGHSEQDPDVILQAVKNGIRSVATIMKDPPAAVSFSTAMHSVMAMDGDGKALTPLIIWADNRSQPVADRLRHTSLAASLHQQSGTPVHAMSPLCKIIWWKEQAQEVFGAAACFIGIKEYIFYHFFGRYITDHSTASATGLFNIHELTWNTASLETAGITAAQLPELVSSDSIINGLLETAAQELGIPANTRFIAGASDGCLAQLGSNALDKGHATLTIGTSGAVRMAIDQPLTDEEGRLFTYVLTPGHFVTGGAINNGGVVLQWYLDAFLQSATEKPLHVDAGLQQAMSTPAGAEGLLCLPYLHGERAPVWDGHAKGAFIGVQPQHTTWHFMRALLEGMAMGLLSITEALEETAGKVEKISVSGGFTHSPEWVQLMADVFQRPMHLRQESDASAMGAVLLGFQALKIETGFGAVSEKVFEPRTEHAAVYRKAYAIHGKLYGALKDIFPLL
ncbi:gluconokinase [Chitinophaga pinensis]|uniref:Carbohydrate kinase FGGY n=1 Tax=Chitinophaga pinensis (strain ATCC 43595 / DSM 2588 / LMG 13176 / NBRC 15968 / NCIMB 11800 / UQM 2034) TaxID=485918 RepID=A0A979G0E3_CHIPD|nr:gluconokinase [Chitinophaga pinensis]ACU58318.1 carbohydrate kinase FGGY [Chitinophaga pinensis DSM 2588]